LTLLFIGLKLGKIITWNWIWVLSPLWGPFVLFCLFLLIIYIIGLIINFIEKRRKKKN